MGSEFKLMGNTVSYPEGFAPVAKEFGAYLAKAGEAYGNFVGMYQSNKGLNELIYMSQSQAQAVIGEMIQRALGILSAAGVQTTWEEFTGKYSRTMGFEYDAHIAMTLNAQAQIMAAYQQRMAMKGPQAYANGQQLDGQAKSQLSALYKDERTKQILCGAVRTCILNVYYAVLAELEEKNTFTPAVKLDVNKAAELYATAFGAYGPDANQVVQAIFAYPGEKQYYDCIFWQLLAEESTDFEDFLTYWGVDFFYPAIGEKRNAAKDFDKKIKESELANFDFNMYSAENYVFLRKKLVELGIADALLYPEFSGYAGAIRNYCQSICIYEALFMDPNYVTSLPQNVSIEEFVRAVHMERDALPINPYRSLWMFGDMVGDKVPLCPKPNVLQAVAYENDCVVFNCPQGMMGGKGIMITSRYIVDLGKNIRIPLANVVDIMYYGENVRITDGMNFIDFNKLSAPYINTKQLPNPQMKDGLVRALTIAFLNLIKVYCIRYGGNQYLQQKNPNLY